MKTTVRLTTEEFITRSVTAHNNFYTYEKTNYINYKTKVTITCPIHGDFNQRPSHHMNGHGCSKCRASKIAALKKDTQETFISKAKSAHGDLYDYSKVRYLDSATKVEIICTTHGSFWQTPNAHIMKYKCPTCSKEQIKPVGWTYTDWENAGKHSNNFVAFSVYIIRCYNNEDEFFKIGKTFTKLENRFYKIPYSWELIDHYEGSAREVSSIEIDLHNKYKQHRYTPKNPFGGITECFSVSITPKIKD